jgi:hypothetical protein
MRGLDCKYNIVCDFWKLCVVLLEEFPISPYSNRICYVHSTSLSETYFNCIMSEVFLSKSHDRSKPLSFNFQRPAKRKACKEARSSGE